MSDGFKVNNFKEEMKKSIVAATKSHSSNDLPTIHGHIYDKGIFAGCAQVHL